MNENELDRVEIIKKVSEKKMKQSKAAKTLGISVRQIKRLKKQFKRDGVKGLVSRKLGKSSNHQLDKNSGVWTN